MLQLLHLEVLAYGISQELVPLAQLGTASWRANEANSLSPTEQREPLGRLEGRRLLQDHRHEQIHQEFAAHPGGGVGGVEAAEVRRAPAPPRQLGQDLEPLHSP